MKTLVLAIVVLTEMLSGVQGGDVRADSGGRVPADIKAVMDGPMYRNATWGLRVVDVGTGKVGIDLEPRKRFYIGSVRKVFSVGELLNEVGPTHTYDTPVYRRGDVDRAGTLRGDLILVASGDLTMGGRTNPNGSIAFSDYDHNEADSLGNATLTAPDPLAGYAELARQVAASGIRRIRGDVIIDDRLFQPFNFRGEFDVTPIFVNDDVVDLIINPTTPGDIASVGWRPVSAAMGVRNMLVTSPPGSQINLDVHPPLPERRRGRFGPTATITGQLPVDYVPPLTHRFPLVQTVRITKPTNYARTVFIEALRAAGVSVDANATAANPAHLLPAGDSYRRNAKTAELIGLPYADTAKLILKVSYNIGADTSLVLFGLSQGVDNMDDALKVERRNLVRNYGIDGDEFQFVDGSGGGDTKATNRAVTQMLTAMRKGPASYAFFDGLPILGVDGSLGFVTDFRSDPTLAGATGQVRAKTGTFVQGTEAGVLLKCQALGGYVKTKGGRQLVFQLVVNNVTISGLEDVLQVFQDEGRIAAMLWRDN